MNSLSCALLQSVRFKQGMCATGGIVVLNGPRIIAGQRCTLEQNWQAAVASRAWCHRKANVGNVQHSRLSTSTADITASAELQPGSS